MPSLGSRFVVGEPVSTASAPHVDDVEHLPHELLGWGHGASVESASRHGGAAVLCSGVAAFQVALAAGAPWGRVAYGGGQVQLSDAQRITSGGAALLWTGAALALLAFAGELAGGRYRGSRALRRVIWLVAAISGFGAVLNLASPSMGERLIWVPVSLATCVLSVLVARSVGTRAGTVPRGATVRP